MSADSKIFKVTDDQAGGRLDIFLSEKVKISRSQIQKLIDRELVFLNGKLPKKAGDRIKTGDEVKLLEVADEKRANIYLQKNKEIAEVEIIAETPDYVVVNKPAGLLVHPTEAQEAYTLVDWLLERYPKIKNVGESPIRPGIVHRLDKEASGLLVIAKNNKMFDHLKKQFQDRTIDKEYLVLVYGEMPQDSGVIDFEIDRGHEGKMVSRPKTDKFKVDNVPLLQAGKEALTEYTVEKRVARFSLLRVKIYTGRTNQIRVHMFAFNHPVVGDTLYVNKKLIKKNDLVLNRIFLHAAKLCFNDLKGQRPCFELKLPVELENFLKQAK